MRLALKAHFRFIIVLALCLATPLAVLADFNVEPPCPMMADGSMPGGVGRGSSVQDAVCAGSSGGRCLQQLQVLQRWRRLPAFGVTASARRSTVVSRSAIRFRFPDRTRPCAALAPTSDCLTQ